MITVIGSSIGTSWSVFSLMKLWRKIEYVHGSSFKSRHTRHVDIYFTLVVHSSIYIFSNLETMVPLTCDYKWWVSLKAHSSHFIWFSSRNYVTVVRYKNSPDLQHRFTFSSYNTHVDTEQCIENWFIRDFQSQHYTLHILHNYSCNCY